MRYDTAVIGGGPSGAVAAAELAKAGLSVILLERNLENVKPCGGAIPLGLIEEFSIPDELVEKAFPDAGPLTKGPDYRDGNAEWLCGHGTQGKL